MGRVTRAVTVALLLVFVSMIALRPLLNNPAIAAIVEDGTSDWRLFLWTPLLLVTALIVGLRLRTMSRHEAPQTHDSESTNRQERSHNSWADETSWTIAADEQRDGDETRGEDTPDGRETTVDAESEEREAGETSKRSDSTRPDILTGQGGTRNKGFEIEEGATDAELSEHLEHLQATLGDDVDVAADLEGMAEVARETENPHQIPKRCPQANCSARWRERKLLGFDDGGRFERLDDESTVICLECEQTHSLE